MTHDPAPDVNAFRNWIADIDRLTREELDGEG